MGKTQKIIFIIEIILGIALFLSWHFATGDKLYIRGQYGEYCYVSGEKPKTITHPLIFHSLQDCLDSFK